MPYINISEEVYVDLDDFDDDDLVKELESRGYNVAKGVEPSGDVEEAIWRYKLGYIEDAMLLLERAFPELYGISKHIRS